MKILSKIDDMSCCGVYRILCSTTGRFYIGSTRIRFNDRLSAHALELSKNQHRNLKLQGAWNKYGPESFSFEIVEICDPACAYDREQFYMDSTRPFFNQTSKASPSANAGPHHGMARRIESEMNEIVMCLVKCGLLESFCNWRASVREFFGFPAPKSRTESVKVKIRIGRKGKGGGPVGQRFTEEHKNALSVSRGKYLSRMKESGLWPPDHYKRRKTAII